MAKKTACDFVAQSGDSMWRRRGLCKRPARVIAHKLMEPNRCGLRIYFDPKSWNVNRHGLIYSDTFFINSVRNYFVSLGIPDAAKLTYSEQGMQGTSYVHIDTPTRNFVNAYLKMFAVSV